MEVLYHSCPPLLQTILDVKDKKTMTETISEVLTYVEKHSHVEKESRKNNFPSQNSNFTNQNKGNSNFKLNSNPRNIPNNQNQNFKRSNYPQNTNYAQNNTQRFYQDRKFFNRDNNNVFAPKGYFSKVNAETNQHTYIHREPLCQLIM